MLWPPLVLDPPAHGCGRREPGGVGGLSLQYGRIVGSVPAFEDVALALVEAGDPEALQAFLQTKLQVGDVHVWLARAGMACPGTLRWGEVGSGAGVAVLPGQDGWCWQVLCFACRSILPLGLGCGRSRVGAWVPCGVLSRLGGLVQVLGRADKAQATMVATWLTELLLDRINQALLETRSGAGGAADADANQRIQQLR